MYIHRRFVVQAIRINAEDPAKSPYGQSVHSAFDSACKHIQDLITLYSAHPRLVARMHPYWTHSFSAAVSNFFFFGISRDNGMSADCFFLPSFPVRLCLVRW